MRAVMFVALLAGVLVGGSFGLAGSVVSIING
jgi:hypothetical protein